MVDVEALYRKYGPMVLRRCRHLLGDEDKALDAMQECFVRVLRSKERLNGDAPSSLLYCMATNVCLNILRSSDGTRLFAARLDPQLYLYTLLAAVVLGLVAAMMPARRAARLDPAQAIRI